MAKQTPDADFAKVQEWYIDALASFVERYPRAGRSSQLSLALGKVRRQRSGGVGLLP